MPLTDETRLKLSDAIEENNDIKAFIADRIPRVSAVRLFIQHIAAVDEKLKEEVIGWTISYPLNPKIHYRMRSRAKWTGENSPVVGVIHAADGLSLQAQVAIQQSIELLEMYPEDLAAIAEEILALGAINGLTADEFRIGASLCIKLNYAYGGGASRTCTANVCPAQG